MSYLTELTEAEALRQRDTLNLIASENYPSPATLSLLGTIWNAKYAEGLPGKRYYAGNVNADKLETYVQELALRTFDAAADYGVNVQVLSGSPANAMVYLSCLKPGGTILSLSLPEGGHLSHLHETSSWMALYRHENYHLKQTKHGYGLDVAAFEAAVAAHRPQLVIIGFSAYPASYDFAPLVVVAHRHGALVLADIAHIAGLVATGRHSSPFAAGADYVTTTTHKTLRGPRGALVFARHEHMDTLNKTVFPGTSGGPHLQQIAATGQALLEVVGEEQYPGGESFVDYIDRVLATAKALEAGLIAGGLTVSTPTSTHLVLAQLPKHVDSLTLQNELESLGIITNRNAVPGDKKSTWRPSGLRLGTAALASRGLSVGDAEALGRELATCITEGATAEVLEKLAVEVRRRLSWPY